MTHDRHGPPAPAAFGARLCRAAALACPLLCLSFVPAGAATKYAGEFLKLGVGARALGMGGAFVALADDASAAYWNPAGMAQIQQGELLFMHAEQFGSQANHDYFGFVQPLETDSPSSVGIGLIRFSVDDILVTRDAYEDLNENGQYDEGEPILTDEFTSDSDTEYGLLLTYGRQVTDRVSLGGNLKLLRQGLLDNTSFGMGVDLGLLFAARPGVTLGARLSDATTTRIAWDTGHRETVAPTLAFGFRLSRGFEPLRGTFTAAGDFGVSFDGREEASQFAGGDLQGGLEYWYDGMVAARVGSDAGNFTAGAGLQIRSLGVDYAFLAHDELDDTHRVSASLRF